MHKPYLLLGKYQITVISYLRNETAQVWIVGEIWRRWFWAADHVVGDGLCLSPRGTQCMSCLQWMSSLCSSPLQISNQRRRHSHPNRARFYSEFDSNVSSSPGSLFHRRQHVRRAGVMLLCTGFSRASQGSQHQSCHPTCQSRPCLNPCHNCETKKIRVELSEIFQ